MKKGMLQKIYEDVDKFISTQKNCCTKGCSFCCHQQIEIMNFEKEMIRDYIKTNLTVEENNIVKEGLNDWLDFFDVNTPNNKTLTGQDVFTDFGPKAAKASIKCPFLIENVCSIYKMRPFTCRMHIVEHSPQICNTNKLRDSSKPAYIMRAQIVNFLKSKGEISVEPLAYAVADIFLPDRKLKPIEKAVLR